MRWNPDQSLSNLPEAIKELFVEDAQFLLTELKTNKLEVILIDAPEPKYPGHKIRTSENSNPPWYKVLYNTYPHFRRDRSIKALERISLSEDRAFATSISKYAPFKYHAIYRDLILERLTKGSNDEPAFPLNKKAAAFFKNRELRVYEKDGLDEDYED